MDRDYQFPLLTASYPKITDVKPVPPTKAAPNYALRNGMKVTTCGCCCAGTFVGYDKETGKAIVLDFEGKDYGEFELFEPSELREFKTVDTVMDKLEKDVKAAIDASISCYSANSKVMPLLAKARKDIKDAA